VLEAALRRRPKPLATKADPGAGGPGTGTHQVRRPPFQPDQPAVVV